MPWFELVLWYLIARSEGEFAAGHPAGAVNIPIGRPGPDGLGIVPNERFLLEVLEKFPLRDDKLLVVSRLISDLVHMSLFSTLGVWFVQGTLVHA